VVAEQQSKLALLGGTLSNLEQEIAAEAQRSVRPNRPARSGMPSPPFTIAFDGTMLPPRKFPAKGGVVVSNPRKVIDCRNFPSEKNCTIAISGTEEEVLDLAVLHAVRDHGHSQTAELREQIRSMLKDEPAANVATA